MTRQRYQPEQLSVAEWVRDEMVVDVDLAPAFLDLAGLPIPAHMQEQECFPLAERSNPSFRKDTYYEYYEWPNDEAVRPHRGIRSERYKYIHYTTHPEEAGLIGRKGSLLRF
ncbi:MAG: DUF4976 domain-containing protein [Edaphobacter sp.]|uniref:sulfatase/phosphatase domain-containing protein n=1 Tax=Edaphobacter sp. TaxID=1934404 RepID=UPI002386D7D2|nr:sulfatase/phosphatase domain-containing protein [Edaphobacter sp.]MDE1175671.1 DUF4976 domain-containing protein [Edaphobacter sp.]